VFREGRRAGKARNVIFMVADGMSIGTLTLADACRRHREDKPATWISLLGEPGVRRAAAYTNSADSHVTDSSAGSTAWGIGEKVNNGAVGVTPDGRTPTPILVQAAQQGKATGLVTTTTVTHATPAGFIANVPARAMEGAIAEQIMDRGFDVVLGGGRMFFPPATLRRRSATLVTTAEELRAQRGVPGPLLGLFAKSQMAFELDRPAEQPDLSEMAGIALDRLFASPHGFVLQIEGGRVDHAAHSNDAASLVADMLAFDRAVRLVWERTRHRDDTLVIVTTDHGNANPALTKGGPGTWTGVYLLNHAQKSFEWIFEHADPDVKIDDGTPMFLSAAEGKGLDPRVAVRASKVLNLVKKHQGVELTQDQAGLFAASLAGRAVDPFTERCSATSVLGSLLANRTGVSFLSANHTSDMVEVMAWGPGSQLIAPVIQNTDLHGTVVASLDLAPARPVA
jgi:alkaline phosphatase